MFLIIIITSSTTSIRLSNTEHAATRENFQEKARAHPTPHPAPHPQAALTSPIQYQDPARPKGKKKTLDAQSSAASHACLFVLV